MLTHVDSNNNPTMTDVSGKQTTTREAVAVTTVRLPAEIFALIDNGELSTKKGPVFQTAIIAGTMAAKNTHALIPFCHPLAIESCKLEVLPKADGLIEILARVKVTGKTGVEMEALVASSTAALTIYDMCKALSHDIVIEQTRLIKKTGGKSDFQAQ